MARLVKQTLGKVSGGAGNVVFRDFGDETFISSRPRRYKVQKDFKLGGHKLKFYYSLKITKTIIKIKEFKEVWNKSNMPGKRGYNRMISANYKLLKDGLPSVENIITPKGRALLFDILEMNSKGIKFSFGMAGLIKPPFILQFVFVLFNPIEPKKSLYEIIGRQFRIRPDLAETLKDKNDKGKYVYSYDYGKEEESCLSEYQNVILYAAVVGTSTIKGKKWWTSTVAVEIQSKNNE
jgi:hypothetical protein